ncbi:MAG: NAD(P)/FAD-dependent oxidoreductase [Bacillota bacterium]|nr:NAD(P)/FAD-dependent oxidoreductase [Bacillota bacterium]
MNWIERDVIIVGAGPAGSVCAAYLAKAGVDVLLLDRDVFPRDKAAGDMVSEAFSRHMMQLEVADRLDRMSVFINRMLLVSGGGSEALIDYECYSTKRRELEVLLVDTACSWGAEFRPGCRVIGLVRELGKICGVRVLSGGIESELRAKIVIGADGAMSFTAKEAGLMKEAPEAMSIGMTTHFEGVRLDRNIAIGQYSAYGTVFLDQEIAPGYLWIMPAGDGGVLHGICSVGMVVDYTDGSRKEKRDLEARFADWLSRSTRGSAMLTGAKRIAPWYKGKQTFITQNMKKTADGLMLIGDAASVMLPLRGDGLAAAADSARAAADTAWEAIKRDDYSDTFLSAFYRNHEWQMDAGELTDTLKTTALIRESLRDPAGVDRTVEKIRLDKSLAERIF